MCHWDASRKAQVALQYMGERWWVGVLRLMELKVAEAEAEI